MALQRQRPARRRLEKRGGGFAAAGAAAGCRGRKRHCTLHRQPHTGSHRAGRGPRDSGSCSEPRSGQPGAGRRADVASVSVSRQQAENSQEHDAAGEAAATPCVPSDATLCSLRVEWRLPAEEALCAVWHSLSAHLFCVLDRLGGVEARLGAARCAHSAVIGTGRASASGSRAPAPCALSQTMPRCRPDTPSALKIPASHHENRDAGVRCASARAIASLGSRLLLVARKLSTPCVKSCHSCERQHSSHTGPQRRRRDRHSACASAVWPGLFPRQ